MKPVTREEQYLNRLTGEEQEIPEEPVTREEQYLARLCGQMNSIPEKPVTRREEYLANLCGEDVIIPEEQVTRMEQYMAFAAGARETKPEKPVTREEMYWDKYQGGDVPEEKTIAFTDIITVTDALARPAVDLQTEITATQNLNGYDYPWVGGAGKNKYPIEVGEDLFVNNGEATHSNDNGVLVIVTSASSYSSGVYLNDQSELKKVINENELPLTVSMDIEASAQGDIRIVFCGVTQTINITTTKTRISVVATSGTTKNFNIYGVYNGATLRITNLQIEIGSTASEYAPYENICPISGRTEVNVTRTGKNLLRWYAEGETRTQSSVTGTVQADGGIKLTGTASGTWWGLGDSPTILLKAGTYTLNQTGTSSGGIQTLLVDHQNNTVIISVSGSYQSVSFTLSRDTVVHAYNKVLSGTATECTIYNWVELGSTATAYEPYEGDTFNTELGRTVYGGTLDLTTGELTITHAYVDLGDLTWTTSLSSHTPNLFGAYINNKKDGNRNFITTSYRTVKKVEMSLANGEATGRTKTIDEPMTYIFVKDERATTAEEFTTLVTGQKMVYELATPQTISLTPTEVQMLENNNTIWADSGRVQLTYLSKAAQRVQTMNASLQANALKLSGLKKTTKEGGTTK